MFYLFCRLSSSLIPSESICLFILIFFFTGTKGKSMHKLKFKGNILCSEIPESVQAEMYFQLEGDKKEFSQKQNEIKNVLVDLFSHKEICQNLGTDPLFLKQEIKKAVNQVLGKSKVSHVYFSQFVVGLPNEEFMTSSGSKSPSAHYFEKIRKGFTGK